MSFLSFARVVEIIAVHGAGWRTKMGIAKPILLREWAFFSMMFSFDSDLVLNV